MTRQSWQGLSPADGWRRLITQTMFCAFAAPPLHVAPGLYHDGGAHKINELTIPVGYHGSLAGRMT